MDKAFSLLAKSYGFPDKDIQRLVTGITDKVPAQKHPKRNPKKHYNRDNLFNFLVYLKSKKHNPSNISRKLDSTKDASNTTITRLMNNKDYSSTKDYKHVWDALVDKYAEEFQDWLSE